MTPERIGYVVTTIAAALFTVATWIAVDISTAGAFALTACIVLAYGVIIAMIAADDDDGSY
jgi:hypothetical protein